MSSDPVPLAPILQELGLVVPPNYDGSCYRCSKGIDRAEGICMDCEDLCAWTKEGFETTVRGELKKGLWYLCRLGENSPSPECAGCKTPLGKPVAFIGVFYIWEEIFTYYACAGCRTYTIRFERYSREGPRYFILSPLPPEKPEKELAFLRGCDKPQHSRCECIVHEFFKAMAEKLGKRFESPP